MPNNSDSSKEVPDEPTESPPLLDVYGSQEDQLRLDRIKRQINDGHAPAGSEKL